MVEGALSSRSSRRRNHPLPVRAGTMSIQSRTRPVAHAVWATKDRGGVLCEGRDPWLLATLGRVALSHGGGGVMLLRPSSTTFFARGTATRREFSTPRGSCRRGRHRRDLDRRAARRRRALAMVPRASAPGTRMASKLRWFRGTDAHYLGLRLPAVRSNAQTLGSPARCARSGNHRYPNRALRNVGEKREISQAVRPFGLPK